ncbi:MAG: leucyl/phenylalanyl-tRNA--protein transferase [Planctomycetota bacterium]|nr:leucyl/phenylalanyl-tRNA--protein transferase [Planctomycetota bacterium]
MNHRQDIRNYWKDAMQESVFPDVSLANEFGVVAVGGPLSVMWVLNAYGHGIFPWPLSTGDMNSEMVLGWFSPDPRAVLFFDNLCISRRLSRKIRSGRFRVTTDTSFDAVVAGCSSPRKIEGELESGTWITEQMKAVYGELHRMGIAHSVEVWEEDALVGGLYGISVGRVFCGESMFYRTSDASKVGLCRLVQHLEASGYELLDIQQSTPHCLSLGASEIDRGQYLGILSAGMSSPADFGRFTC